MLTTAEVRARRAVEKLSQAEFARKLGISRERLINIESDKINPDEKIEVRYNELYKGERIINITWTRGADCPKCGGFGRRIWRDESNPERDVYECVDCDRVYRAREAWAKPNNTNH
jgi:transcriptional regulator with XRE-family HTH domain